MKILVTGGAGFIGSAFIRHMVKKYPTYQIINFDMLSYAGNLHNLKTIEHLPNYEFIKGDICDLNFLVWLLRFVDVVVHFAAESHVDNSIGNSLGFTRTNVVGTHTLLEAARTAKVKKFIHISTDEVYGDIMEGKFLETDKLSPTNPYSASKAAAEMIAQSYIKTFNMPIIMIRGNNNFGPFQFPEKIIPRFATCCMNNTKLPLHSPHPVRTYIHVNDYANAVDVILHKGEIGEVYNVGTDDEYSNIQVARKILEFFGKGEDLIANVDDRPFNDLRYSVDFSKLQALGWSQQISFEEGLKETLHWYKDNKWWWNELLVDQNLEKLKQEDTSKSSLQGGFEVTSQTTSQPMQNSFTFEESPIDNN